ncbi:MAG TPA: hypothetical protein VFJ78_01685 [Gaiellaceae bacterium]|nr:hypothetical protein [Gaiellaceae bacterium]
MDRVLRVAAWVDGALFVVVGVGELLFAGDSLAHRLVFAAVLVLLAALVVAGVAVMRVRTWVGAAMASVAAVAGGFALFWTIAAIPLALTIVVLSLLRARRSPEPVAGIA